jgi:DNA-binding Lrp family transcriptional regulator
MLNLDDLDVLIFREFNNPGSPQWNVRESFTAIARRLGVDEETVRLRVGRLRERGVIPAWKVAINPCLLGYQETGLDLEVEDASTKPAVLARLRSLPGITQFADFQGSGIMAILWHDRSDPLPWFRKQIDRLGAWTLRASWTSPFPEPTVKMRAIDWRIVTSMRDDARKDLRTVASLLRTTVRTVQRRLSALTEGKAVFVVGIPNVDRAAGLLCNYLVYCPDVDQKRLADSIAKQMFPRIGMYDTDPAHHSIFGVSCENLSRAEESLAQLRSLYGVDTVRLGIVRKIFHQDDWIDGLLRQRGLARGAHPD